MKAFNINANDAGQRVDRFVGKMTCNLSPALVNKYLRLKRIKVNGKKALNNQKLNAGDLVEMYINDEFFPQKDESLSFLNAKSGLNVVFEDENLIICDKPAGLIVHEDIRETDDTLINRILKYLYEKKEFDPKNENSFTPALCNRIDRNTAGLVIGAKNAEALRIMNLIIKERLVEKKYLLITVGKPPKEHDTVKSFMEKIEKDNIVRVYDKPHPNAKTAITEYKVLSCGKGLSLVEVTLHTGRTHQIRAQMSHMGCPLLGDGKYGINREDKRLGFKYQALYSYSLTFKDTDRLEKLSYLKNKTIKAKNIWLIEEFSRLTGNKVRF